MHAVLGLSDLRRKNAGALGSWAPVFEKGHQGSSGRLSGGAFEGERRWGAVSREEK